MPPRPLVVKMDVEGAEWDALMQASDATLQQIDQMAIEFHFVNEERFVAVLKRLREFFHVAHLHYNNVSCSEGLDPFPVCGRTRRFWSASESESWTRRGRSRCPIRWMR